MSDTLLPPTPIREVGELISTLSESNKLLPLNQLFTSADFPKLDAIVGRIADTLTDLTYEGFGVGTIFLDRIGYIPHLDWFYTIFRESSTDKIRFSKVTGLPADNTGTTWTAEFSIGTNSNSTSVQTQWTMISEGSDQDNMGFYHSTSAVDAAGDRSIFITEDAGVTWDSNALQTSMLTAGLDTNEKQSAAAGFSLAPAVGSTVLVLAQSQADGVMKIYRTSLPVASTTELDIGLDTALPGIDIITRGIIISNGWAVSQFEYAMITNDGTALLGSNGSSLLQAFPEVRGDSDNTIYRQLNLTTEIWTSADTGTNGNGIWYSPDCGFTWTILTSTTGLRLFFAEDDTVIAYNPTTGEFYTVTTTGAFYAGTINHEGGNGAHIAHGQWGDTGWDHMFGTATSDETAFIATVTKSATLSTTSKPGDDSAILATTSSWKVKAK